MTETTPHPRVFVVHQPTGRDASNKIVPTLDLTPAGSYGELVILLKEHSNPFRDPEGMMLEVMTALRTHEMNDNDYVLLVGSPVLIGWVAIAAAQRVDRLRMLQWSKRRERYQSVELHLNKVGFSPVGG